MSEDDICGVTVASIKESLLSLGMGDGGGSILPVDGVLDCDCGGSSGGCCEPPRSS